MSQPPSLRINPDHVTRQFARRSPLDAAQFLYGEVAQRMLQRLSYIRIAPVAVLDAGCGAAHALEPLRARYPSLDYTGLDSCVQLLNVARERYAAKPGFWQKLRNKPTPPLQFVQADLASSGLAPESQDLVWSNMALHWHAEPHEVLSEWRRILKPGALVMFSCLGPGSMAELREAVASAGLKTATPEFVDMHDFGDLLIERGFADPVMDQEILTLTYRSPQKLLDDMRILGGNPSLDRKRGLSGRAWRQKLMDALEAQRNDDGTIHLSLELAYGHAWRSAAHKTLSGETRISIGAIGRSKDPNNTRPTVKPRKPDES
ncbi:methyltransferase domain-containing protein [Pollutimonas harenae]|uniref:Malonyl-[acyl-carrier protein] O-methyltransferase n=1 Tax=Pollutimonas harenae TaxID=657015 RepID=A0A853H2Y6_9BURK|nr:methyltransferase domain-containing protein [Pollutimonas harenae]NYT84923.1 methyltransferase domain-containing protein [Pollutimonas harenae]TEA72682.1 methyltransferase domain-containing protein [Pollutimonas harenae]